MLLHFLKQDCLQPLNPCAAKDDALSSSRAMRVVAYINDHYQKEFSIQDLCERFFVSKNVLCSEFRRLMRCSVMQYRQFMRISKAKELLSSTNKSVKKIAEECGFSSENYFSLIFKREVSMLPTNYRKTK